MKDVKQRLKQLGGKQGSRGSTDKPLRPEVAFVLDIHQPIEVHLNGFPERSERDSTPVEDLVANS